MMKKCHGLLFSSSRFRLKLSERVRLEDLCFSSRISNSGTSPTCLRRSLSMTIRISRISQIESSKLTPHFTKNKGVSTVPCSDSRTAKTLSHTREFKKPNLETNFMRMESIMEQNQDETMASNPSIGSKASGKPREMKMLPRSLGFKTESSNC